MHDNEFDPRQTFAPFGYANPVNRYRSASGVPGPDYWQNRADYAIRATLDPDNKILSASEVITYTNYSPDALYFVWLQLDQNRYRPDARANFSNGEMPALDQHTAGFQLDAVQIERGDQIRDAAYLVSDTRMRIALDEPLAAKGGVVNIRLQYRYTVPDDQTGGRTQWTHTPNGDIFDIAQWYPRLCVYDDIRGWDTAPFLNQEFYTEYGDYDYAITVPSNLIVVGSGQLQNPQEVLTTHQIRQLHTARDSDKTVPIRGVAEANDSANQTADGWLTWHFHMHQTRDVAFAASAAYVWDAACINRPGQENALAMAVYPVEAAGDQRWGRAAEYLKHTTENFAERWGMPYPYPVAVAAGGPVAGMEYPGIVFDSSKDQGKSLFALTAHEIGHTWFPMIVGSDERRHAWMDEGMNTFIDVYAAQDFNNGEYAPKRDSEFAPGGGNPVEEIVKLLNDPDAPPILTRADLIAEPYRHPVTYFKAALGFKLLREQILGPERFDAAFKHYIRAWAYKHPKPSDFFRLMDSAAGEDLSWFWRGWFAHNWKLDLAVTGVQPIDGDYSQGARITVANLDRLVMPATLRVSYADGSTRDLHVPVATWMQHHQFTIKVAGDQPVAAAEIDPDHLIPDVDRSNNRFETQ